MITSRPTQDGRRLSWIVTRPATRTSTTQTPITNVRRSGEKQVERESAEHAGHGRPDDEMFERVSSPMP
jgi:hypothetical protein